MLNHERRTEHRHHTTPESGFEPGTRMRHPADPRRGWRDQPDAHRRHPGGRPGFPGEFAGPGEWGGPGGPPPHRRGPRGRAGRGDVRTAVLLLVQGEPMHGYQLMQAVADRTGGAWRVSPGAVYPTISQLEDEGLVQITSEGGRKLVTLTDAGAKHIEGLGAVDPFAAFSAGPASERIDLRDSIEELMGAARQLSRVGDTAQLTAAQQILADAKRALYLVLAGDQPRDTPTAG